jgi:cob(I)alamin adenosyltransferase
LKIYTKTGDEGKTSLIGGSRVPKDHIRIECYGTVDELCSWVGLIADQDISDNNKTILMEIQDRLFTIESLLAAEPDNDFQLPEIQEQDIELLEKEIDRMNDQLPTLRSFVLPGGHTTISYCHLARTVCRRAERLLITLGREYEISDLVLKYLNRLSDYLFMFARELGVELNVPERLWKPRK